MECVDIVNERDETIGNASKQEAHDRGELHRCVIAEIIDSEGDWILVKQAPDRQDAGQFVSPVGGHVRAGESVEDALRREAEEEAGIRNFEFRFVGKTIYNREVLGRKENHYFLQYEIFTDAPITINHESVAWERFSPDELKNQLKNNPEKFGAAFHFVVKEFYPVLL